MTILGNDTLQLLDEDNNRCVPVEDCPCPACDPVSDDCSSIVVSNSSCSCPVCAGELFVY